MRHASRIPGRTAWCSILALRPPLVLLSLLAAVGGCDAPEPPAEPPAAPTTLPTAPPPAIAREQLFFSGRDDDGVVLATWVLQWQPRPVGAVIELKGFVATDGVLRSPIYERVVLPTWPGGEVSAALDAWRAARAGDPARVLWRDGPEGLHASLRSPGGAMELTLTDLAPAGGGVGPHGRLVWRAGRARLELNGAVVEGVGVAERLRGDVATPAFGRFELWLLAPKPGLLVLGRRTLGAAAPGEALRVDRLGRSERGPFDVEVVGHRLHEPTGFELPTAWTLPTEGVTLSRGGTSAPIIGSSPSGGPAVYDIGLATSARTSATALVFHLQDR